MNHVFAQCLRDATNVYRTAEYIVKQVVAIKHDERQNTVFVSYDTYYYRTPDRDRTYERLLRKRVNVDGRRLSTSMYSRVYIY